MIVDNTCTHNHSKHSGAWSHVRYTPPHAYWLNQVERCFRTIARRAIRRGSFSSVKDLIAKIEHFIDNYNKGSAPFSWTAAADSILRSSSAYVCEFLGRDSSAHGSPATL